MQADVEMYLAASPPLFSPLMGRLDIGSTAGHRSPSTYHQQRSPFAPAFRSHHRQANPLAGLEFDFRSMALSPAFMRAGGLVGRAPRSCGSVASLGEGPAVNSAPLRSCLVIRSEGGEDQVDSSSCWSSEPSSPVEEDPPSPIHRGKKRVVFADANGLPLTHVKMMTEPSDCPPRWSAEFLDQVTGGASAEVATDRWELTFAQPASDYIDFRAKLDRQNISLENVVIEEADGQLVGTVKVKNLAFSKQVIVRVTFDNWLSQTDVETTYVPTGLQGQSEPTISLYDTFSFKIAIPSIVPANKIQFCLRYTSDAGEFWDSNCGKNYVIVRHIEPPKPVPGLKSSLPGRSNSLPSGIKYNDLLTVGSKLECWADFASWNHLVADSPYW